MSYGGKWEAAIRRFLLTVFRLVSKGDEDRYIWLATNGISALKAAERCRDFLEDRNISYVFSTVVDAKAWWYTIRIDKVLLEFHTAESLDAQANKGRHRSEPVRAQWRDEHYMSHLRRIRHGAATTDMDVQRAANQKFRL